jgi:hypothetical protein
MTQELQQTFDTADRLQSEAHRIIEGTGIQELWAQVGQVFLVGSARFGLMASPNIDFETYVEKPDPRTGFFVMCEIASLPGVTQIQYHNFLETEDPGLYWRIDYRDGNGVLWDFDNWLVPFSHPYAGMADAFAKAMSNAITPTTRAAILAVKSAFAQSESEAVNKPRGIDIYKAVLKDSVRTVEDFREWQTRNPPVPMETWRP